jgi:hypothetical protein
MRGCSKSLKSLRDSVEPASEHPDAAAGKCPILRNLSRDDALALSDEGLDSRPDGPCEWGAPPGVGDCRHSVSVRFNDSQAARP